MHVEHKGNHEKLSHHKKIGKSINLTTVLIRRLRWIICSDEVLRLGLETIFVSLEDFRSHLALKGHRSRSQACCLETVSISRIWLWKTSVIQQVFSVVLVSKKQSKQIGKVPEITKIQC